MFEICANHSLPLLSLIKLYPGNYDYAFLYFMHFVLHPPKEDKGNWRQWVDVCHLIEGVLQLEYYISIALTLITS